MEEKKKLPGVVIVGDGKRNQELIQSILEKAKTRREMDFDDEIVGYQDRLYMDDDDDPGYIDPDYEPEKPLFPVRTWDKHVCDYCGKKFRGSHKNVYADEPDARPMCNDCYIDIYGDFCPSDLDLPNMGWVRKNVKKTTSLRRVLEKMKFELKNFLFQAKFWLSKDGRHWAFVLFKEYRRKNRQARFAKKLEKRGKKNG